MTQALDTRSSPAPSEGPPAVGAKLQAARKAQQWSLDELSKRAGVSKSMLSEVERNQANPTVAVLWRLTTALGLNLTELLSHAPSGQSRPTVERVLAHAMPTTTSPDGKCSLRILGPIALAGQVEWYELTIEPGGVLASDPHDGGTKEHLSVVSGHLTVQAADSSTLLKTGDSARYFADVPHTISNIGKSLAKAVLVVEHLSA